MQQRCVVIRDSFPSWAQPCGCVMQPPNLPLVLTLRGVRGQRIPYKAVHVMCTFVGEARLPLFPLRPEWHVALGVRYRRMHVSNNCGGQGGLLPLLLCRSINTAEGGYGTYKEKCTLEFTGLN